jgi:hypothetical protein
MAQTILPRPRTASYAQAPFTSPIASSSATAGLASKATYSSAELIERISETHILHEKREQVRYAFLIFPPSQNGFIILLTMTLRLCTALSAGS